jgi:hypothetical protein
MNEETKIKKIKFSNSFLIKGTLLPFVYLAILVVLFTILFKVGLGKYFDQQKLLKESRKQENIFGQKISYLSENQSVIKENTGLVSVALPEKNPALLLISKVKSFQGELPLLISNIKVTAPSKIAEQYSLGITFNAEGDLGGITDLVDKLLNILPITLVNKVTISGGGSSYLADVKITTFYENLPKKIPSVNDPIKLMSKESMDLLTKLQTMERPDTSIISPQSPAARTNPFE